MFSVDNENNFDYEKRVLGVEVSQRLVYVKVGDITEADRAAEMLLFVDYLERKVGYVTALAVDFS